MTRAEEFLMQGKFEAAKGALEKRDSKELREFVEAAVRVFGDRPPLGDLGIILSHATTNVLLLADSLRRSAESKIQHDYRDRRTVRDRQAAPLRVNMLEAARKG